MLSLFRGMKENNVKSVLEQFFVLVSLTRGDAERIENRCVPY
jgi:hypothetical protein